MAQLKIDLVVDDKGKLVFTGFGNHVDKVMFSSRNAVANFGRQLAIGGAALTAFAAGAGLLSGKLIEIADRYTMIDGRLKLVTDSSEQLARVEERLYQVSLATHQGYEQTATLYTGLARATKELHTSEADLLFITESLNKATIVSGATQEDSANSLRQMNQAIQGGVVRAEEYNSILENTPRVLQAVAEGLGLTMGELRREMLAGSLTAEKFLSGFKAGAAGIDAEFKQLPTTTRQAWTDMETVFGSIVNESNKASGATGQIAGAIINVSQTIDKNRDGITSLFVNILGLTGSIVENLAKFGTWLDNFGEKSPAETQLEEYKTKIGELMERRDRLGGSLSETEQKTLAVYRAQVTQLETLIRIQAKRTSGAAGTTTTTGSPSPVTPPPPAKTGGILEDYSKLDTAIKKYYASLDVLSEKEAKRTEDLRKSTAATTAHILALNGIENAKGVAMDSWQKNFQLREEYQATSLANMAENEKSFAEEAKNAVTGWASEFSSSLNDMLWNADSTFGDILTSFAKMLTQMVIQETIVKPLLEWGGSFISSAHGNAFSGAGISSYSNQIVSKPTIFPFASGIGLMGEKKGSPGEAIMPLTRMPGTGNLGVEISGNGGGSLTVVNNITVEKGSGGSDADRDSMANKIAAAVKMQVKEIIGEEKRYGGILYQGAR